MLDDIDLFSSSFDNRQITLVTLSRFCLLSKKKNPPPVPNGQYQDGKNTHQNFYIVFQILKVLLIKIFRIQSLDLLFLVVFISFYINRYHFSQVFRNSFNIIWKKDFRHKFSFFNGFTQLPLPNHPLNSQNPLSMTEFFFSMLPNSLAYHGFLRLLCYNDASKN